MVVTVIVMVRQGRATAARGTATHVAAHHHSAPVAEYLVVAPGNHVEIVQAQILDHAERSGQSIADVARFCCRLGRGRRGRCRSVAVRLTVLAFEPRTGRMATISLVALLVMVTSCGAHGRLLHHLSLLHIPTGLSQQDSAEGPLEPAAELVALIIVVGSTSQLSALVSA